MTTMTTMTTKTFTSLAFLSGALLITGSLTAADDDATSSRHTFRSIRSGTAAQLEQPRLHIDPQVVQIVRAQPLRGEGAAAHRVTSSTGSAATSDLLGSSRVASAPMRSAIAAVEPTLATAAFARQTTPLIVSAAEDDAQPVINDRAAVDNNARLAGNYSGYQATTVSYDQVQLALAAHRVQEVGYGNTYGTYSPAAYHGRLSYSYAPRTYYRPSGYYGHTTVAYSSPRYYSNSYYTSSYSAPAYYAPTYYAPTYYPSTYYRPSYSYCAPTYYRPSYSFGYSHGYGHRGHSYGHRHGSSWGFSVRW